ncbi:MAG: PilZ domain-containing protein [Gammaproteobacteria bacterium]|nr:PilZ domain-containing protein [Gammaproteobacteria bacterium]
MPESFAVDDRRSVYRVNPAGVAPVSIAVRAANGAQPPIRRIEDLSAYGAALSLAAPLESDERVELDIRPPDADHRVSVGARVLAGRCNDEGWHYRFAFDTGLRGLDHERGAFFELFNRRAAQRGVRPAVDAPVLASVRVETDAAAGRDLAVRVHNLSVGGVCLAVTLEVDAIMAGADPVRVYLGLPDDNGGARVELVARTCYRAVADDAVVYGLRFDAQATPDFIDHAEDILSYLLRRFERDLEPVARA